MNGLKTIKQMYQHTIKYWHDLFQTMPCYAVFNKWLNKLGCAFIVLIKLY